MLGAGLGSDNHGEFEDFEEVSEPRERAELLDDGLAALAHYWDGEFQPQPAQQPRIPIWVAARYPNRKPLVRARRWDGLFPIDLPGPEAVDELRAELPSDRPFDLVVEYSHDEDPAPWEQSGATWVVASFGKDPKQSDVTKVIDG